MLPGKLLPLPRPKCIDTPKNSQALFCFMIGGGGYHRLKNFARFTTNTAVGLPVCTVLRGYKITVIMEGICKNKTEQPGPGKLLVRTVL
jgi:hypothetical protein